MLATARKDKRKRISRMPNAIPGTIVAPKEHRQYLREIVEIEDSRWK